MTNRMMKSFAAALVLGLAGAAAAHDDATLDKTAAPNGGQLRMAGPYHLELVVDKNSKQAKDNAILVYVTDHAAQKVPASGMKASAKLLAKGASANVDLLPDGDNRLKGAARYASDPAMKVVVTLTTADGKTEQARFEPLKPAGSAH